MLVFASGLELPMGGIVRRVAIVLSIVVAAVTLWYRRVEGPVVPQSSPARSEVQVLAADAVPFRHGVSATPGWHTVTLPFDDALAGASLIAPGSRIDILTIPTRQRREPAGSGRAETVAQNVRVLAVAGMGMRLDSRGRRTRAVPLTVEVRTREEVDRLITAMRRGDLRYMLRGQADGTAMEPVTATLPIQIPAPAAEAPCTNRRDSTLVYDAVLLSCAKQAQTIFIDSAVVKRNRSR